MDKYSLYAWNVCKLFVDKFWLLISGALRRKLIPKSLLFSVREYNHNFKTNHKRHLQFIFLLMHIFFKNDLNWLVKNVQLSWSVPGLVSTFQSEESKLFRRPLFMLINKLVCSKFKKLGGVSNSFLGKIGMDYMLQTIISCKVRLEHWLENGKWEKLG